MTPIDIKSWDEMEDKLLHVLTYKNVGSDICLAYVNKNFEYKTESACCFEDEMELEDIQLNDSNRCTCSTQGIVQLMYYYVPEPMYPELVHLESQKTYWAKLWGRFRNAVTLKKCRTIKIS